MSWVFTLEASCDKCQKREVGVELCGYPARIASWEIIKTKGWKLVKGKHLCPKCIPKRKK